MPGVELHFLTSPSNLDLLNILPLEKKITFSFRNVFSLMKQGYTDVIDFEQWMRTSAIVTALQGSRNALGFRSKKQFRHMSYTHSIPMEFNKSMAESFFDLCQAAIKKRADFRTLCLEVRDQWLSLFKAEAKLPESIPENSSFVVFHPGCGENGSQREWPISNWQTLAQEILKEFPNFKIYSTGAGFYETQLSEPLTGFGVQSLSNKLNFSELIYLLLHSKVVFCSNTGIMHLASFLNPNVVAFHGPTNPKIWGPIWNGKVLKSNLACSPCLTWGHDYGCSDPVCLNVIESRKAFMELRGLI